MKDFLFFVFLIFAVLLAIEAALYLYVKKRADKPPKRLNKEIKTSVIAYAVIFSLFSGWLYFFEDRTTGLECLKDTMTCRHFHTTYSDGRIRLVGTYDISRVTYAKTKKHYRRRGASYYTVELIRENGGFDLPPHHSYRGAAEKEAGRFNEFLNGEDKRYVFRETSASDSFGTTVGFMACLFAIFLEIRLFWDLAIAAFKECKKAKNAPKPDGVVQRRH